MKIFWIKKKENYKGESWFHRNDLVKNTEKTMAMSCHTRQNGSSLKPQTRFDNMNIKYIYSFTPLACAECNDSLPFSVIWTYVCKHRLYGLAPMQILSIRMNKIQLQLPLQPKVMA